MFCPWALLTLGTLTLACCSVEKLVAKEAFFRNVRTFTLTSYWVESLRFGTSWLVWADTATSAAIKRLHRRTGSGWAIGTSTLAQKPVEGVKRIWTTLYYPVLEL